MKSKKQIEARLCDIMSTLAETEENSINFNILIQKKELLEWILND